MNLLTPPARKDFYDLSEKYQNIIWYIEEKSHYENIVHDVIRNNDELFDTWIHIETIYYKMIGESMRRTMIEKITDSKIDCGHCRERLPHWVAPCNTSIPKTQEIEMKYNFLKSCIDKSNSYDKRFQKLIKDNAELNDLWGTFQVYYTMYFTNETEIPIFQMCNKRCAPLIDWR